MRDGTDAKRPRAGTLVPLSYWRDARWSGLGSLGRDLLVLLLSYSADNLSDGHLPAGALRMISAATDDPERAVRALTDAGLLVQRVDGSADLPDSTLFNLSRGQVETLRAKRSEAGSKRAQEAARGPNGSFLPAPYPAPAGTDAGEVAGE